MGRQVVIIADHGYGTEMFQMLKHPFHGCVREMRNPMLRLRSDVLFLLRLAERTSQGSLTQEPPRRTRREQSPEVQALPSVGAPE